MKVLSLICLLSLAAQAWSIPTRRQLEDVTSRDNITTATFRNIQEAWNMANTSAPIPRSVPTTLVTSVNSSFPNASTSHLEPRRPPRRPGKAFWNVVYYGSWNDPSVLDTMPWDSISHVLYAFASIDKNGTVHSANPEVDERNIKLLRKIKLKYRHVKVFLSIGGYTYSQPPYNQFAGVGRMAWRQKFADSAVNMMQNYGFDGLDIDWEYPVGMGFEFLNLLETTRWALNDYQNVHGGGFKFLMTIAVSIQTALYDPMNWPFVNGIVDAWFIMAYDYAGSWSNKSAHQANVYGELSNAVHASTADSLIEFTFKKTDPRKMMLGMPTYGHSFIQAGKKFGADFKKTEGEDDIILYKDIDPNWDCGVDYEVIGAWCHDGKRLISYDNLETVQLKVEWAINAGMRGAMFWQAEGDKPGADSLIVAAAEQLPGLDGFPNQLHFPLSEFNFTSYNNTTPGVQA